MSKFALIFFVLAPIHLTIGAQPRGPMPDSAPPRVVVMAGPVEVPLVEPGIPGSTLPVIQVMINGRGPYRFAVETGARFVGVSPGFAARAGLAAAGRSGSWPAFQVDSMNIGTVSFKDFRVAETARGATGVDGILGLPFFYDVLVTIDYPAGKLRLSHGSLPEANGEDVLALSRAGPFWSLPVEFAGAEMRAILDTRSMGSLSMVPETAAKVRFDGPLQVVGRAGGAAIAETEVRGARLDGDVRIGQYTFPRPMITSRPLPPGFPTEPVVGDVLLRNFVVTLDQKNARLRLERSGSSVIELPVRGPLAAPPAAARPAAAAEMLEAFVGNYGDRTVSLREGKLYIQRPGGRALELLQTGRNSFIIAEVAEARIEFTRNPAGAVDAIRVFRAGSWETVRRSQ